MTAKIIDFAAARAARMQPAPQATHAPAASPAYVPAYCDPANERRGPRYDRRLSTKEIAALIRAEIKASLKRGEIAKGVKVSVRYESFSGGSAIRINVTQVPAGFVIHNEAFVRAQVSNPHDWEATRGVPHYAPEAVALLAHLTRLGQAYNRDNSDTMVDYFDVNYYGGDAGFDWRLEGAARREMEAKIATKGEASCSEQ